MLVVSFMFGFSFEFVGYVLCWKIFGMFTVVITLKCEMTESSCSGVFCVKECGLKFERLLLSL